MAISLVARWFGGEVTGYRPKDALGTGLNFRKFSLKVEIIVALLSISEIRIEGRFFFSIFSEYNQQALNKR